MSLQFGEPDRSCRGSAPSNSAMIRAWSADRGEEVGQPVVAEAPGGLAEAYAGGRLPRSSEDRSLHRCRRRRPSRRERQDSLAQRNAHGRAIRQGLGHKLAGAPAGRSQNAYGSPRCRLHATSLTGSKHAPDHRAAPTERPRAGGTAAGAGGRSSGTDPRRARTHECSVEAWSWASLSCMKIGGNRLAPSGTPNGRSTSRWDRRRGPWVSPPCLALPRAGPHLVNGAFANLPTTHVMLPA